MTKIGNLSHVWSEFLAKTLFDLIDKRQKGNQTHKTKRQTVIHICFSSTPAELENLSTDNNVLIFGHRLSKLRKNIIYAAGV